MRTSDVEAPHLQHTLPSECPTEFSLQLSENTDESVCFPVPPPLISEGACLSPTHKLDSQHLQEKPTQKTEFLIIFFFYETGTYLPRHILTAVASHSDFLFQTHKIADTLLPVCQPLHSWQF